MRKWRIIALMVAVCFASCQPQQSIDKALAEADSLFAIGQSSLGNHPYMRSILYYQRALDVLQGDDTVSLSRKTRIFAEMGKLYAQRQLYTEAINRFQLSLTCAEQTHDSLGQMLAYKGLGESYLRLTNRCKHPSPFIRQQHTLKQGKRIKLSISCHQFPIISTKVIVMCIIL